MSTTFTFAEIDWAMRRCLAANPTTPPAYVMCHDSNVLSDIYATMLWRPAQSIDVAELGAEKTAIVQRWLAVPIPE
ncbi:putative uncharacterized protein [Burkholderiales bacterium GJ-E10]|nr:putative uncharacterized protein [Burkholderiales bacterium GJ-E10]